AVEGATMSRSTVWRILNDHALKPHQHTLWLHSKDPHFREKVNDIVGLYHADLPDDVALRFNARHGNKFEFHYTPIHASWVNQIEIFFSILGKRVLRHGSFVSKADLKRKVMSFITRWNTQDKHPFHWRFKGYSVSGQEVA
ncbi:MAG: Mobile element protein, partial [Paenibacillaceae bacterium]|nr:Mobile element protein [Paenibacillaceae bacterium]